MNDGCKNDCRIDFLIVNFNANEFLENNEHKYAIHISFDIQRKLTSELNSVLRQTHIGLSPMCILLAAYALREKAKFLGISANIISFIFTAIISFFRICKPSPSNVETHYLHWDILSTSFWEIDVAKRFSTFLKFF